MQGQPTLDVTVVVPLLDEEESLRELKAGIDRVLAGLRFEVIFIDDGSQDGSWSVIEGMQKDQPESVRGIRFARNYGKSAALQKGLKQRAARWCSPWMPICKTTRRSSPPCERSCWKEVWTW